MCVNSVSLSLICQPSTQGHEAPHHHHRNSVTPASDISWFCFSYSHTGGNTVLRLLGSCPPCVMELEIHAFPLSVCLVFLLMCLALAPYLMYFLLKSVKQYLFILMCSLKGIVSSFNINNKESLLVLF